MCARSKTSYGTLWQWLTAVVVIALLLASGVQADLLPGRAGFDADRTIITMPYDMTALVFDTSGCENCRDSVPAWRFIDSLKVDSVIHRVRGQGGPSCHEAAPLTDSSQLEGIWINSPGLLQLLERISVIRFGRVFPGFNPEDTLKWDPIRLKWHHLADMSRHYKIVFPDTLSVDSVVSWLRQVPGLTRPTGISKPLPLEPVVDSVEPEKVPKGRSEESGRSIMTDPWIPNDTLFDRCWHLQEKDWSTGEDGITAACAWGLLKDYERGNVIIGLAENAADTTHPDLGWKVSNCAPDISGHATMMAGIMAAITNNVEGIAGVAPDAFLYTYKATGYYEFIRDAVDDSCKVILFPYSLSSMGDDSVYLLEASEYAYTNNVTLVTTAGNMDTPYQPFFSYPSVWDSLWVSVGAHTPTGDRAGLSNYTCDTCPQLVDILAPGVAILTTFATGGYGYTAGTCAAAAVVSGMAALAYGYDPNITPELVEQKLENTACNTGLSPGDTLEYGYGRVDAYEFMVDIINTAIADERSTGADSVPCIIITDTSLESTYESLADRKTRRGTWTEIVTAESISAIYSGEDLQAKIRACIKDYYQNKHLEWVILGGDGSVVPFRYAYNNLRGPGVNFICDYYYACLDGDWNYDGDTLYGEVEDSVDLIPEVAVGRLPFSSTVDVTNYIAKLDTYESPDFDSRDWQCRALFLGSHMFQDGDGERMCQDLLTFFPSDFDKTEQYDGPGGSASLANYFQAMNAGQGIVVKHGLAGNSAYYDLRRQGGIERLRDEHLDTLKNHDMPSVVFAATCFNHRLDRDSCMAIHYMKHPTGGAIAYIGSTYNDFVFRSHLLAREFFDRLFCCGPYYGHKEVGHLLNLAKQVIEPESHHEGAYRHTIMGYMLSGDPQMCIWTGTPEFLTQLHVDSVVTEQEVTIIDRVLEGYYGEGEPVSGVTVCLMKGTEVYEVAITSYDGQVSFTVSFPDTGDVTLVASRKGYIYDESTVAVVPCCRGVRGNVNGDPIDAINVADQTYLIAFLFDEGPPPPCTEEGNVDGIGEINIGDLSYLVDYLFFSGPAPPECS